MPRKKPTSDFLAEAKISGIIAADTETTGLTQDDDLFCISLAYKDRAGVVQSKAYVDDELEKNRDTINDILSDPAIKKRFHNAIFDIYYMRKYGADIPFDPSVISDTMIMAHILHPEGSKKLKALSVQYIDPEADSFMQEVKEQLEPDSEGVIHYDRVDRELLCKYAAKDAELTYRLHDFFDTEISALPQERIPLVQSLLDLEIWTMKVLYDMQQTGMMVDREKTMAVKAGLEAQAKEIKARIMKTAREYDKPDFNPDSNPQVLELLKATGFDTSVLPDGKTTKSFRNDIIDSLSEMDTKGLARDIVDYRHATKMVSIYLDNFLKGKVVKGKYSKIVPHILQCGTITGRFSCISPNFQNIPGGDEIRQCIVAEPGWKMFSMDYKQIEPRMLAHYSKDFKLTSLFIDRKDIYTSTAALVFKVAEKEVSKDQRTVAKQIILGIMYGMGASKMALVINKTLGKKFVTEDECRAFIYSFYNHYQTVKQFRYRVQAIAQAKGMVVSAYGRHRKFEYNFAYQGVNTLIQGTTADFMRYKMVQIDKAIDDLSMSDSVKMILQVHDEVLFVIKDEAIEKAVEIIGAEMKKPDMGPCQITVPIDIDIEYGQDWGHLETYKG